MNLLVAVVAVFLLNIPFGYWRSTTKKFSLPWVLAIHLPVPGVILLRTFLGIGWDVYTFPVLIGAFFAGQYAGLRLSLWMTDRFNLRTSGCLVMDVYRQSQNSEA